MSFTFTGWPVPGAVAYPSGRGKTMVCAGFVQRHSLPDDAIGVFVLTLSNVAVGSRVHVETQVGATQLYDGIAASSTVAIPLSAYAPGSANNDLRVKVRKSSAQPKYQPFETLATASVGEASIFVSQVPDTIAA